MQSKALVIIRYLDSLEKGRRDVEALKRAFLTAQIGSPEEIFPEIYASEKKDITEVSPDEETEGMDYDYSDVTWKSGSDAYSEYERLMSQVSAAKDGMMSGDMVVDGAQTWTDWS